MVFGLFAVAGGGAACMGDHFAHAMKDATLLSSVLCLLSILSGAIGNRTR